MAISINWLTFEIYIPKSYLTLVQMVPTEIYSMDTNQFRLDLKALEETEEGMTFPKTHNHNPPVSVGGVELARVIEILPPYTLVYEDDQYAVNLQGSNSNIADVTNVNQVSIRSANSAGLVNSTQIDELHKLAGLQVDHPLTVQTAGRSVADITQTFTGADPVIVQRT